MRGLIEYAHDLRRTAGRDLYMAFGFVALGAVLETIGLITIFPLLALLAEDGRVGGTPLPDSFVWMTDALDRLNLDTVFEQGLVLSALFVLILIVRAFVLYKRDTMLFALNFEYIDEWRMRLFRAVGRANWSSLVAMDQSAIEHAIHSDITRLRSGSDTLLRSLISLTISVVLIGAMLVIGGFTFVIVLCMIGLMFGVSVVLVRKAGAMGQEITKSGRNRFRILGQFMTTQKLARLHDSQEHFTRYFVAAIDRIRKQQVSFNASQAAARTFFSCLAGIAVVSMFMLGYFWIEMPLPVLGICMIILVRLTGPLQSLSQAGQAIAHTLPAYQSVREMEKRFLAASGAGNELEHSLPAESFASLSAKGVSFGYSGSDITLFEDANITVSAGETVVLRGRSGMGKTTLLDVLMGLIPPRAGQIWSGDTHLITHADFKSFRRIAAFVPQDPFLFNATVKENLISFGNNADVSDDEIWAALDCVEIGDLLRKDCHGLDAMAGEQGRRFSGGERQRICLARALLRRPSLLVLDEATNALDPVTEAVIMRRLREHHPDLAILMVTHRDIDALVVDRVYKLETGALSATRINKLMSD